MNLQVWYESARESVDDIVDQHFESLRPEGHRLLTRIWQYLRDQEVEAIQTTIRATARPTQRRFEPAVSMAMSD